MDLRSAVFTAHSRASGNPGYCVPAFAGTSGEGAYPLVLRDELAGAILVDMDAHDLVERALRLESQLTRPLRLDALRPALDHAGNERIALAPDARGDALAGNPLERVDLLGNRAGDARHGEIDARPEALGR